MRESIGTAWIYGLVLTFVLLFTMFLTLIINYSGVFMYKNDVVEIMEKYEGYTETSRSLIDNYLSNSGYKTTGTCPEGYYGATKLDGKTGEMEASNAYYCILVSYDSDGSTQVNGSSVGSGTLDILLFYKFNLPVLGDLMTFDIPGQTNIIKYLYYNNSWK